MAALTSSTHKGEEHDKKFLFGYVASVWGHNDPTIGLFIYAIDCFI